MNILILGGTQFLGRHFVEIAIQQGYKVTIFNRGKTHSNLYPNIEKLIGDRLHHDLNSLQNKQWDIVIDTAGYFPNLSEIVKHTAELLQNSVKFYIFISTISVYSQLQTNGDETLPLFPIDKQPSQEITPEVYGIQKAMAESIITKIYGENSLILRPGLIVGPYDNTGRFTYWIKRIAQGGEILAPESPNLPVQIIDARDLVQWIYQMASNQKGGIYNTLGPDYPLTLGQVLETCQQVTGTNPKFTWIPGTFLASQQVGYWQELPLWLPPELQNTFPCLSNQKATANGLKFRPLSATIHDIWQWDKIENLAYNSGLATDKEQSILATWHQNQANITHS